MNKSLRYLIFALLLIGIGYAIYSFMNKPATKSQETTTVAKENAEDQKVAQDSTATDLDAQAVAQAEEAKPAEEVSEVIVEQEQEVKPEDLKPEDLKKEELNKEELNKDSKPAKR